MRKDSNRFGWTSPITCCVDLYSLDHHVVVLNVVDLVLMFNFNVFVCRVSVSFPLSPFEHVPISPVLGAYLVNHKVRIFFVVPRSVTYLHVSWKMPNFDCSRDTRNGLFKRDNYRSLAAFTFFAFHLTLCFALISFSSYSVS